MTLSRVMTLRAQPLHEGQGRYTKGMVFTLGHGRYTEDTSVTLIMTTMSHCLMTGEG